MIEIQIHGDCPGSFKTIRVEMSQSFIWIHAEDMFQHRAVIFLSRDQAAQIRDTLSEFLGEKELATPARSAPSVRA